MKQEIQTLKTELNKFEHKLIEDILNMPMYIVLGWILSLTLNLGLIQFFNLSINQIVGTLLVSSMVYLYITINHMNKSLNKQKNKYFELENAVMQLEKMIMERESKNHY